MQVTITYCDSCGRKTQKARQKSYMVGIDQGPMGAEKEFVDLDLCPKCFKAVPSDESSMPYDKTKLLIQAIKSGQFA